MMPPGCPTNLNVRLRIGSEPYNQGTVLNLNIIVMWLTWNERNANPPTMIARLKTRNMLSPRTGGVQLKKISGMDTITKSDLSELGVWNCLNSLNPWKSGGPDNIPSWVFKEYAMILSLPVMKIINSSYTENKLPPIWKQANIIPVPKVTHMT